MSIDWSNAPEGATHYNCGSQFFYRFSPSAEFWSEGFNGWTDAAAPTPEHYQGDEWVIKATQQDGQLELAKVLISLSGDIRQPINASQAAWMAAQLEELGYRKFEIVEEDV